MPGNRAWILMADNNSSNALVMELADADAGARVLLRLIEGFRAKDAAQG
jgi:hypothetical protein